jgi:uncharacterized protein YoxC
MDQKTKWMFGIVAVIIIVLLLWLAFKPSQDLKEAINNLKDAKQKLDNINQKIDNSLLETQEALKKNASFKNYIYKVDSITRKRDEEARKRERAYQSQLENVNKTIERLKGELSKTTEHLPLPPLDTLKTN